MEIILSKQCKSLTGSLGHGFGYFIQRRRDRYGRVRFYSQRYKCPPVPRDGHIRFIIACTDLADMKLHLTDIQVSVGELRDAMREAQWEIPESVAEMDAGSILDADAVRKLKIA